MTTARRGLAAVLLGAAALAHLTVDAAPRAMAADGTRGKYAGFHVVTSEPHNTEAELRRIRRSGANSVAIMIYYDVDTRSSNEVHPGDRTPQDGEVVATIQRARQAGIANVALVMSLWCGECGGNWRGEVKPSDPDAFFASYEQYLTRYAQLGEQAGANMFFVGTEMSAADGPAYTKHWRKAIAAVRALFDGSVTYDVNWDALTNVQFWDALDLVSVSAYMPLHEEASASLAQFKAAWRTAPAWGGERWFDDIAALHRRTGKKILFGEIGYLSSTYNGRRPYDDGDTHDVDYQAQINAYQAVYETFEDQPWWAGALWWRWLVDDEKRFENGRSPRAKPVEEFLTKWWAEGWRPPATPVDQAQPMATSPARPGGQSAGLRSRPAVPARPRTVAPAATTTPPTVAAAAPTVAPAPTLPPAVDPLVDFERRMAAQQAIAASDEVGDIRFRRASGAATMLAVLMALATVATVLWRRPRLAR